MLTDVVRRVMMGVTMTSAFAITSADDADDEDDVESEEMDSTVNVNPAVLMSCDDE